MKTTELRIGRKEKTCGDLCVGDKFAFNLITIKTQK